MMSLHRRHKGKRQSLFILFLFVLVLYTEGTEQALAQLTELVSKSSSGVLGNSDTTLMNFGINSSDISSDGRFVAFTSAAKNLVSGDTNNVPDVFVHDRNTKKTTRISVSNAGVQGNSASINPAISPDGRYVAFESGANNLVPGDTNGGLFDLFMYDRVIGKIERISVSSSGAQGNHNSTGGAAVSENGRYVAFTSWATNLVAGDTNGYSDIFVRDRVLGTTTLVSKATNGAIGDDLSRTPKISADGRYIVFTSLARNLEPITYLDPHYDVFVHDRTTGVTVRVNVSSNGNQPGGVDNGDYTGEPASISADGRYVAFAHNAPLDPLDTELATRDVFVRDLVLGKTTLVSLSNSGTPTSWPCWAPSISADGRFVAFLSNANDLVAGDTNGSTDVFVRDRIAGTTTRVSVSSNGAQGNLPSGLNTYVAISAHGNFVAFLSAATNLVVGDTNGFIDLFVHTSCPITAATPTPLPQLQAGPYPVASWDWDFGTVSTTNPNSGLPLTVNHFGRLWYPTNGAGGALPPVATGGPFSLLVFGHGNYTGAPQFGNNHTGFDYLMAHLASWGIVASSVNLDVISLGVDAAISQRGDILLETINKTVALSSQPGVTPPPWACTSNRE